MSKHALKVPNFTPDEVRSEPRLQIGLVLTGLSRLLPGISLLELFRSFPTEVITLMTVHRSHSGGWTQGTVLPPRAVHSIFQTLQWWQVCCCKRRGAIYLETEFVPLEIWVPVAGKGPTSGTKFPFTKMGHSGENQMYPLSQGLDEPLVLLALLIKFCGPLITTLGNSRIPAEGLP